jgi:hypothetical protein
MPRDDISVNRPRNGGIGPPRGRSDAVRIINETLKGRVAAVFRSLIPVFETSSGEEFYDVVMNNSEMLHGCIAIFRRNQPAFRNVLVDARGRPVNDEFVALRCGRSVHDVIAMIVRTHAKRHFKATLGGDPNDPASRAGAMYKAINEYLIHDWQVPLVPHYAPLPLAKVQEMGPRLLDIREAEILVSIAEAAASPYPLPTHSPQTATPDLPQRDQRWWKALNDPAVIKVLGERPESETRELAAALAEVNDLVHSDLFARLRLDTNQAAVILVTAYKLLGRAGFRTQFGIPGKPTVVAAVAQRLDKREAGPHTDLKALPQLTEAAFRG